MIIQISMQHDITKSYDMQTFWKFNFQTHKNIPNVSLVKLINTALLATKHN